MSDLTEKLSSWCFNVAGFDANLQMQACVGRKSCPFSAGLKEDNAARTAPCPTDPASGATYICARLNARSLENIIVIKLAFIAAIISMLAACSSTSSNPPSTQRSNIEYLG